MTGIKQTKKRKQSASAAEPAEKPNEPVNSKVSESDSGSDSEPDSEKLTALLEPYSKDQLIDLISAAAVKNPSLYKYIREAADREETHRKIFVYGLGWDTTRESLISAFETSGEIEDCKLVTDKVTGKAKGYAFILFKTRKSAMKALSTPQRKINNRVTSCQLASVGPAATSAAGGRDNQGSAGDRKIYVSNVQRDVDKQKLREFFERYGEIETGPIGFDVNTGKSRGFALFVYKTVEGAKKALDEPIKMFGGHQLHCQKAADGKNKTNISSVSNSNNNNTNSNSNNQLQMVQGQQMLQGQRQGLDALAAAQNWALLGQGLNPAVYGGLLANPGLINPVVAGALTQGVVPTSHVNMGAIGSSSMLGGYGAAQGLQNVYPNAQNRAQGSGGTYPGYTSYI